LIKRNPVTETWIMRRKPWHTRRQEEVQGMAGIAEDNALASNGSAGSRFRPEASWCVKSGLESIPERTWGWERITPSFPKLTEL
jgi:hypothetical protein